MEQKILTKNQIDFLEKLRGSDFFTKHFYLTGGTALAAFYLKHRYSEDLDFFSENEFDVSQLSVFLKTIKKDLGISKIDFQQSYNRNLFFLTMGRETLKTEFTFFPFSRIEKGAEAHGVAVDSLLDIAVNKLFTIYQRTKARDYIDLYFICRGGAFSIHDLIQKAKAKFDWHIDLMLNGRAFLSRKQRN
jgi:predicted nucleotidyltransferase component of viral defense system